METIKEIQLKFEERYQDGGIYKVNKCGMDDLIEFYRKDSRTGVQKICNKYVKEKEKIEKEFIRIEKMKEFEHKYEEYPYICGVDEVGRGPLAGPVVAGAVILPKNCTILYLNDSKQISEKKRELLYEEIMDKALAVGIGVVTAQRIDEINILQATYEAMREAVKKLEVAPSMLLNDAVHIPELKIKQVGIIKGDEKSVSIAAASIVAKVTRDRMMAQYHELYSDYRFDKNKGYGSPEHIQTIREKGACAIHRKSFIKNFVS